MAVDINATPALNGTTGGLIVARSGRREAATLMVMADAGGEVEEPARRAMRSADRELPSSMAISAAIGSAASPAAETRDQISGRIDLNVRARRGVADAVVAR